MWLYRKPVVIVQIYIMVFSTVDQNGVRGKLLDAQYKRIVATNKKKYEWIWTVDISAV